MLQDILGEQGTSLLVAVAVVAIALLALFLVFRFMRSRSTSTFIRGGRNRQPRLAVLDAAAVDARRRLVLIRRDDVEHLILIGGPTDLVVESRIAGSPAQAGVMADRLVDTPEPAAIARSEPVPAMAQRPEARLARAPEPRQSPARPDLAVTATPATAATDAPSWAQAAPVTRTAPAMPATADLESPPRPAPTPPRAAPEKTATEKAGIFSRSDLERPGGNAMLAGSAGASAVAPRPPASPDTARKQAIDALDAARARVLPETFPRSEPQPEASERRYTPPRDAAIDYNPMEESELDFESVLEAELSADLSDLTPAKLPEPEAGKIAKPEQSRPARDSLEDEMERLLGDLSVRP